MKDIPCPACGGDDAKRADCPACQGEGCAILTRCPHEEVPPEVWDVLDLCADADKGLLPVSGGVLDQVHAFNHARRIVRIDTAYFKAQATKPHNNG